LFHNYDYQIFQKAKLSDDEQELILKYRNMSPEMKIDLIKEINLKQQSVKQSEKLRLR